MKTATKIAIVLCGYALACVIAIVVVHIYVIATAGPDRATYDAMFAFGDLMLFLGVLGVASIVPSALALWFLRGWRPFWVALSVAAVASAALGIAALVPWLGHYAAGGWFVGLAPIRVLAAPLFALAAAAAALLAPAREFRVALFGVAVSECAVFAIALLFLRHP